jgi:hypothetical protein
VGAAAERRRLSSASASSRCVCRGATMHATRPAHNTAGIRGFARGVRVVCVDSCMNVECARLRDARARACVCRMCACASVHASVCTSVRARGSPRVASASRRTRRFPPAWVSTHAPGMHARHTLGDRMSTRHACAVGLSRQHNAARYSRGTLKHEGLGAHATVMPRVLDGL